MRRQLKKTKPSPLPPKKSRVTEVFFAACLAGLVGLVGAGLTWYSSDKALKQSMYESCIKRVDEQESKLRDKAGVFLALRAEWLSKNINPNMKKDDYYRSGEKAIAAANELSIHAPLKLGLAAMNAGEAIAQIMSADTPEKIKAVKEEIHKKDYDLLSFFFEETDKFQQSKKECSDLTKSTWPSQMLGAPKSSSEQG
ncbi:hypothetical protein [Pseudomonas sp. Root329]|uniref:hypothetical protein n=1 Tax=Pseudomonas sp. Root329 TaxID=1736515 RepID=UPI0012E3B286|nr:hypothetical protein [Pseudomonas sp. Root329]